MKSNDQNQYKILVVDDDPDISMMLKLMLEYKGFSVTLVDKAEETINVLQQGGISMAIIDMLLSGMSGTDICGEIRQNKDQAISSCPVLMISAHPNAREICLQAGADEFISKPFDMSDILAKINILVNKPR
jgi:DNA-binding response OmpR family regulator